MRVVVHLGQPRTGTTSLQYFLGWGGVPEVYLPFLPSFFRNVPPTNHYKMSIVCLNENRLSPPKIRYLQEGGKTEDIEQMRTVIKEWAGREYKKALDKGKEILLFSSEDLYLLNYPEEYSRLIDLFSEINAPIEAISCFRGKESFKESWSKRLKYNGYILENNPDDFRCISTESFLFDYERKKELIKGVFDKCIFFSYNEKDNTKEFLNVLGYGDYHSLGYKLNQSSTYE